MASEMAKMAERLRDSLDDNLPGGAKAWTRGLAAGSLLTGAVLLATGRRKSGLAVTVAGSLVAMLEDSDAVRELLGQTCPTTSTQRRKRWAASRVSFRTCQNRAIASVAWFASKPAPDRFAVGGNRACGGFCWVRFLWSLTLY